MTEQEQPDVSEILKKINDLIISLDNVLRYFLLAYLQTIDEPEKQQR